MSTARDGVQTLLASLFDLPTTPSEDGPVAQLPPPTTQLPRAKPLPKPKPLTKWEKFANAKGIQKKRKDKKEERLAREMEKFNTAMERIKREVAAREAEVEKSREVLQEVAPVIKQEAVTPVIKQEAVEVFIVE